MAVTKKSLRTFDPDDARKIIEKFKQPNVKHVNGSLHFVEVGTFVLVSFETDKEIFRGDDSNHTPSGIFLLLSRYDLVRLLKDIFDLRDK